MHLLVVEDEPKLAALIARALDRVGHTVVVEQDGRRGLDVATGHDFQLVILDVNLPSIDGFTLLRRLRELHVRTRVLMLTARGEIEDRVAGLRAGADDYLVKPFAMDELLARVEALGRRAPGAEAGGHLQVGDLRLDVHARNVTCAGTAISLSPREFDLLRVLMEEPGRAFTRDELFERIWQREHEYATRTVEMFIVRLRKKLEQSPNAPTIETVRGVGYKLSPAR
jgi:DNA-binding response OmpR family regulator